MRNCAILHPLHLELETALDNREDRAIWKALDDLKSKADRILKDRSLVSQYWGDARHPGSSKSLTMISPKPIELETAVRSNGI